MIEYGYPMSHCGLGGILGAIFWVLVVAAVVVLVRQFASNEKRDGESLREILDRRYAKGEIGKEEYEAKKKDLGLC